MHKKFQKVLFNMVKNDSDYNIAIFTHIWTIFYVVVITVPPGLLGCCSLHLCSVASSSFQFLSLIEDRGLKNMRIAVLTFEKELIKDGKSWSSSWSKCYSVALPCGWHSKEYLSVWLVTSPSYSYLSFPALPPGACRHWTLYSSLFCPLFAENTQNTRVSNSCKQAGTTIKEAGSLEIKYTLIRWVHQGNVEK